MSDETADAPQEAAKSSKLPLILGLVLALAGGAGGFLAVRSGLLSLGPTLSAPAQPGAESAAAEDVQTPSPLPDIAYVPVEPITITVNSAHGALHLRLRAELEVEAGYQRDVETVLPRIIDVLNGYLMALEVEDFQHAAALTRLRAQILRRIQIVAGPGRVRDFLIMEFVLS